MRRSIDEALALHRTEVRPDGLCPENISLRLTISWRARNLHPWDFDLVGERKARKLVEQTFADTVAALERLFTLLPEIDVIDLMVLETDPRKNGILMSGSIARREFENWHPSSTVMRLKLLGLNYNLVNSLLQPLDISRPEQIPAVGITTLHPIAPAVIEGQSVDAWRQDKVGPH